MRYLSVLLLTGLTWGCAHTPKRVAADSAAALYAQGLEDLEDGLYPEAQRAFGDVKSKYPYSRYAALSELRLGDAHLRRSRYLEAIDTFRNFLKYHPTHEQADYALFQIAEAYRLQVPDDWLFLPPGAEKDQGSARMCIAAYGDFLARYDRGPSADLARQRLAGCRRELADHEMYVARFYDKRHRWLAAVGRAEGILAEYPGLGLDAEALWIAGRGRLRGNADPTRGQEHLERLLREFGDTPQAQKARAQAISLGAEGTKAATHPTF